MPEKIITLYCFFDELLKALNHQDNEQAKVSTAEIMTIASVATEFFTGNHETRVKRVSTAEGIGLSYQS